jgi:hypothetical protein
MNKKVSRQTLVDSINLRIKLYKAQIDYDAKRGKRTDNQLLASVRLDGALLAMQELLDDICRHQLGESMENQNELIEQNIKSYTRR